MAHTWLPVASSAAWPPAASLRAELSMWPARSAATPSRCGLRHARTGKTPEIVGGVGEPPAGTTGIFAAWFSDSTFVGHTVTDTVAPAPVSVSV